MPRRLSVYEEKSEPELSRVTEPVKPEPVVQTIEKPALSQDKIKRTSKSIHEEFLHINNSKKLQCLQSDTSSSEATLSERSWSPGELRQQMERLLLEDMASEKGIFNCVKVRKGTSTSLCELVVKILTGRRSGAELHLVVK